MKRILTNEQMRAADKKTIEEKGVPSLELMERAGKAIAVAVPSGGCICVVCGGGNNGGDGYVAARYLLERGEEVCVVSLSEKRSPDCATNFRAFQGAVHSVFPRRRYTTVVDCIFGTGLTRPVEGIYRAAVEFINGMGAFVVSADIPSGLSDCGIPLGVCVKADITVAVQAEKTGLWLNDAPDYCGTIVTADIGIETDGDSACRYEDGDISPFFPQRRRNTHKGSFGRCVILAGSAAYTGAPLLAAGALKRMGTGYSELCVCRSIFSSYIGKYPEVILTAFPEQDGMLACREDALEKLCSASAIVFGPGCGVSEEIYRIAVYLLSHYTGTLVLDADALNAIAKYGAEVLKHKKCGVILTPHLKEFSRLAEEEVENIRQDGCVLAKKFAATYGVTLLLKSAVSVITDGERVVLNTTGSSALAKGGSGDVLSGILGGLAARLTPFQAAVCGAYLLGKAGEEAERRLGAYSATATDVIEAIPSCVLALAEHPHKQR